MPPSTASRVETGHADERAEQLRRVMYADAEFMRNNRLGYEAALRGEGVPADEYFRNRRSS